MFQQNTMFIIYHFLSKDCIIKLVVYDDDD